MGFVRKIALIFILIGWGSLAFGAVDFRICFQDLSKTKNGEILNSDFSTLRFEGQKDWESVKDIPIPQWRKYKESMLQFGYTNDTIWVHFFVCNYSREPLRRFLLIDQFAIWDAVFYVRNRDSLQNLQVFPVGAKNISFSKNYPGFWPLATVDLAPGEVKEVFLKIKTPTAFILPIKSWDPVLYSADFEQKRLFGNYYQGFILAFFVLNLFMYFRTRHKLYLSYSLFLFFTHFLLQLMLDGSFVLLFGVGSSKAFYKLFPFIVMGAVIAITYFVINFYKFIRKSLIHKILIVNKWTAFTLLLIFSLFFIFTSPENLPGFIAFLFPFYGIVFVSSMSFIAGLAVIRKLPAAKFFCAGFASAALGFILSLGKNYGFLPINVITENALQLGFTAEIGIFSFFLADRLHLLNISTHNMNKVFQHTKQKLKTLLEVTKQLPQSETPIEACISVCKAIIDEQPEHLKDCCFSIILFEEKQKVNLRYNFSRKVVEVLGSETVSDAALISLEQKFSRKDDTQRYSGEVIPVVVEGNLLAVLNIKHTQVYDHVQEFFIENLVFSLSILLKSMKHALEEEHAIQDLRKLVIEVSDKLNSPLCTLANVVMILNKQNENEDYTGLDKKIKLLTETNVKFTDLSEKLSLLREKIGNLETTKMFRLSLILNRNKTGH